MATDMLALGAVRSLRRLRVVRGFGRRRIANLRAALSRIHLPENLGALLTERTLHQPAVPEIVFPHPLGPDAEFPPLIARRLLLEAATVRGMPAELEGFPFTHPKIHHFRSVLKQPMPSSVVIVGGGYVGVEIAMAWAAAGCRVTIVESRRQLLAGFIPKVAASIQADVLAAGVGVVLEAEAVGWALRGDQVVLFVETWDGPLSLWGEQLLVAVGVQEATDPSTKSPLLREAD